MRRERNKLAAAKCRNRRRELTDRLQAVSDTRGHFGGVGGVPEVLGTSKRVGMATGVV